MSGTKAHELGLVNAVLPADDLMGTALDWAARIAAHPAAAATMAKRALDSGIDSSLDAALELEVSHALITEHSAAVLASAEAFRSRT